MGACSSKIGIMSVYDDWLYWLNEETLKPLFLEYCQKSMVMENINFYRDVILYKKKFDQLDKLLKEIKAPSSPRKNINSTKANNNGDNNSPSTIKKQQPTMEIKLNPDNPFDISVSRVVSNLEDSLWSLIYEDCCRIYNLYIILPHAPSEINIPDGVRKKFYKSLAITMVKDCSSSIPPFSDILRLKTDEARKIISKYVNVYDSSLSVIIKTIETDIFTRFKRTDIFKEKVHDLLIESKIVEEQ